MNGKFVRHFLAGIVFNFSVNHIGSQFGVTTIDCYVTVLFLTFITAMSLLFIEQQLLVKPLMKEFFRIRCRKKFRFVLKMLNSDLCTCLTGASTALRYSNTQVIQLILKLVGIIVGKALKKHLELIT